MNEIVIIGSYPPPYGGISVHIKRMKEQLRIYKVDFLVFAENKINSEDENVIYSGSYKKLLPKIIFIKCVLIHFHTLNYKTHSLFFIFKILKKKLILTFHGNEVFWKECNNLYKKLLIYNYKKLDKIICVNLNVKNELIGYGINKNKIEVISAYINPVENEYDFINIPESVWRFINNSNFLISANGWVRFYNNQDLYGIDMLIELIRKLKNAGYNVSLLIALLGINMQNHSEKLYYEELINKIKEYNLQSNIMIFEVNDTEFYPILKKSKLFLRPTNTDGDAVSIREALYYKVVTIASDIVERPEGTILCRTRDVDELYIKTIDVIENYNIYKEKIKDIKQPNNSEKLLGVYKELSSPTKK